MLDARTTITITKEPPFFNTAHVRITADVAASEKDRKEVLEMVCEQLRDQLGWNKRRTIHDGLSSDCKLGNAALLIAMNGEHPCDSCNHDRAECRGYPKAEKSAGSTLGMSMSFGKQSQGKATFSDE